MIHKQCTDCGACKPASDFRQSSGGRTWFNAMCRACKLLRCAAANAAYKAKRRAPEPEPEGPKPFVPPTDFLPMGPAANAALVWTVGVAA